MSQPFDIRISTDLDNGPSNLRSTVSKWLHMHMPKAKACAKIEWENDVPPYPILTGEVERANTRIPKGDWLFTQIAAPPIDASGHTRGRIPAGSIVPAAAVRRDRHANHLSLLTPDIK